ncbi:hypothetical protein EVAR_49768_1 [Eumeta japonica]|uniref:Uncharacterized protein n=1 Tax=Eumeta variegata TaxID=151549 RepID=A0A4C1Y091_EUMVA|nr:hypothetical protein EVAR_49768_1 [Eumeta japonica]
METWSVYLFEAAGAALSLIRNLSADRRAAEGSLVFNLLNPAPVLRARHRRNVIPNEIKTFRIYGLTWLNFSGQYTNSGAVRRRLHSRAVYFEWCAPIKAGGARVLRGDCGRPGQV